MTVPAAIIAALAPRGALRAAINLDHPVLANRDAGTGQPSSVAQVPWRRHTKYTGSFGELI